MPHDTLLIMSLFWLKFQQRMTVHTLYSVECDSSSLPSSVASEETLMKGPKHETKEGTGRGKGKERRKRHQRRDKDEDRDVLSFTPFVSDSRIQ